MGCEVEGGVQISASEHPAQQAGDWEPQVVHPAQKLCMVTMWQPVSSYD